MRAISALPSPRHLWWIPTPAPHLPDNPSTPSQLVCTLPKPTITPSNSDVALHTHTPATGTPADTTPTLVNPNPGDVACTLGPAVNPEPAPRLLGNRFLPLQPVCTTPCAHTPATHAPTVPHTPTEPRASTLNVHANACTNPYRMTPINPATTVLVAPVLPTVYGPHDLSALFSDAPNPWGTLRRCHYHHYSCTPHQFGSAKQEFRDFETVKHPHRIGPNKLVIRTPVSSAANTLTHHVVHERAIVKVTPPLPHQTATLRCECGWPIPGTEARDLPIAPLHHTLTTFMSSIISHPFFLPLHFFSHFRFL
jgi:hypothetical protein